MPGVMIMRDLTVGLWPGNVLMKSSTNSDCECAMTARLAYVPFATSGVRLMLIFLSCCSSISFFHFILGVASPSSRKAQVRRGAHGKDSKKRITRGHARMALLYSAKQRQRNGRGNTSNDIMEQKELRRICREVSDIARRVGRHIWRLRQAGGVTIESKGRHDFVTQLDKMSERMLVAELEQVVPAAGFIAEENTRTGRGAHLDWIVDPIDGTTNFIHAQPPFAISVALMEDGVVTVGVIYEMSRDELFAATLGGGASLDGEPIRVSETRLDSALVATGFPYSDFSRMEQYMPALRDTMRETAGVRRLGSAATDMAYVACGRYEAFFEYDLKPYDVAAGCLLVTEAGGVLTDFKGGNDYIFGREMVASNAACADDFRKLILPHFA